MTFVMTGLSSPLTLNKNNIYSALIQQNINTARAIFYAVQPLLYKCLFEEITSVTIELSVLIPQIPAKEKHLLMGCKMW